MISLYDYQLEALKKMKNGCILCGGVGSGKSRTALAYYYILNGGDLSAEDSTLKKTPCDLYIITTARKRDTFEWELELGTFGLNTDKKLSIYNHTVVVDSWNNIKKYKQVKDAFFIFDEQRVVGWGAWTKAFLTIARNNKWILLSATPGDKWSDYIPVFVANGFYRNKTEFLREHAVFNRFSTYPRVDRYISTGKLNMLRRMILVKMFFCRETHRNENSIIVPYDSETYKMVTKKRWNIFKDKPVENISELCQVLRRIVNMDSARLQKVIEIVEKHPRVIIFYNFDYEREILLNTFYGPDVVVAEWSGHKHEPIPKSNKWVYIVHYFSGSEGWNCTLTDTVIFYSMNYSYRTMEQAKGRIDRLNTPYKELYYYILRSRSSIDLAILRALKEKRNFNETEFKG